MVAWCALAIALFSLVGCPRRTRRTLVPKVPTSGNAEARTRFERAQAQFERDSSTGSEEFVAIAEEYPDDPIAPYALLYAGISATQAGDYEKAVASLEELLDDPSLHEGLALRGRLYLGIALNYLGKYQAALPHLSAGERAVEGSAERTEWLAAMAETSSRGAAPLSALTYYDRWYADATPAERAFIVARLRTVVEAVDAGAARDAYAKLGDRKSPSAAILGARVAADLDAAGNSGRADQIRAETGAARKRLGLERPQARSAADGDPGLLGVVLPLSGKRARVGDSAVRSLTLAGDAFGNQPRDRSQLELSIRDSASTSAGAGRAAEALAAEGVIALVGPVDGKSVDAVARRAESLGVPQVSLSPRPTRREGGESPYVFHIMHSAEERARALARYAHENGVVDFAILAPESGYGRAVAGAFRDEVARLGGTVVVEKGYARDQTSFTKIVNKIRKPWQALFVPDSATRLELVAPALAAANLISTPIGGDDPKHGRKILLLSTAEALSSRYLRSAGRYSHGAVLAPGFYPDRFDPAIGGFVDRYEASFGRLPVALEAYAYDAAMAIANAVASGATTRYALSRALASGSVQGLTGTIRFGPSGRRSDDGLLYQVARRADVGDYVIRALRD